MSIRKMDTTTLDEILSNDNTNHISESELDELYEFGMEEVNQLSAMLVFSQVELASSLFAPLLATSEDVRGYFEFMTFFCDIMMPNLLNGNIDAIMEEIAPDGEITEEHLYEMREKIYQILKQNKDEIGGF